ncbi:DHS-like NAD/FAD-binding domain-containing protein, partial [Rhypophila decipiens]
LVRHYTQNIDGLDEEIGLSVNSQEDPGAAECVLLHGSLQFRCSNCPTIFRRDKNETGTPLFPEPPCPACAKVSSDRKADGKRASAIGRLRPNIVLYDELDPRAESISAVVRHDRSLRLDVLLIIGTSLATRGIQLLIKGFAKVVHKR